MTDKDLSDVVAKQLTKIETTETKSPPKGGDSSPSAEFPVKESPDVLVDKRSEIPFKESGEVRIEQSPEAVKSPDVSAKDQEISSSMSVDKSTEISTVVEKNTASSDNIAVEKAGEQVFVQKTVQKGFTQDYTIVQEKFPKYGGFKKHDYYPVDLGDGTIGVAKIGGDPTRVWKLNDVVNSIVNLPAGQAKLKSSSNYKSLLYNDIKALLESTHKAVELKSDYPDLVSIRAGKFSESTQKLDNGRMGIMKS